MGICQSTCRRNEDSHFSGRQENLEDTTGVDYFKPQNIDELKTYLHDAVGKKKTVFFIDESVMFDIEKFKRYLANVSLVDCTTLNHKTDSKPEESSQKGDKGDNPIEQLREALQSSIGQSPKLTIENFTNWANNQTAEVIAAHPQTIKEVQAVISAIIGYEHAHNVTNLTLRCVGAAHSWGPLFVGNGGILLDVSQIESDYPNKDRIRLRGNGNLVDVMPGVTTGDFKNFQLKNKINLPCNVILDVVQMVSVVASGCHGVGWNLKTPGDYITEMRIIQADGRLHKYTSNDKDMMQAVQANFGVFGVIYDITLKLSDEIIINTDTRYETVGNVFLDPDSLGALVEKNWSTEMFWFPFNSIRLTKKTVTWEVKDDEVWIRNINQAPPGSLPVGEDYYSLHNIEDYLSQNGLEVFKNLFIQDPVLVPLFSAISFVVLKNLLYPQGTICQELVQGIHFRNYIHIVPVRDMEFAFDMKRNINGKIDFRRVCAIIKVVTDTTESFSNESEYPLNIALEMRFMSYSDSYMNPAAIGNPKYGGSGHVFFIEVLSLTDTPHFQEFCIQIAKEWMKFEGMPHLAKDWAFIPGITEYIQKRMQPNIRDFRAQYTRATANGGSIMINSALKSILGI